MVPSRITPSRRDNRIGWKLLREPTLTVCLRDLNTRKRAAASPDVAVPVPRRTISRGGIYGTNTTVRFTQPLFAIVFANSALAQTTGATAGKAKAPAAAAAPPKPPK